MEDSGAIYTQSGTPKDCLQILKDNGINFIRLRIWNNPSNNRNDLQETLLMATRIKQLGMGLLLDFHYSDTWADPANQTKPNSWQNLSFTALKDSVYQYTFDVISALKNQNTLPEIVQIGNEISCGMLWDDGNVCLGNPQKWNDLAELLNSGISGVKNSLSTGDSVKIMVHIDKGGDFPTSKWFYDNIFAQNIDFDIIGLSYYPWWHGTFSDLSENLDSLAQNYNKEIVVVETAYPWTLQWFDNTSNIVGSQNQLLPGYTATTLGQTDFLKDLITVVHSNPKGTGVFYWAPEWLSIEPPGSSWENLALFFPTGEVVPSISAFDTVFVNLEEERNFTENFSLSQNYPNPFNPNTVISYQLSINTKGKLVIFDVLGKKVKEFVLDREKGSVVWNGKDEFGKQVSSGIYIYRLETGGLSKTKKLIFLK